MNARGVAVEFIKENMAFTGEASPMQTMMFQVMGAFAQFERSLILERQREGIAIAKAAGAYKGRKAKFDTATVEGIRQRVDAGENVSAIARDLGASRPTIYRAIVR